jgi:cell division protein FtsQ
LAISIPSAGEPVGRLDGLKLPLLVATAVAVLGTAGFLLSRSSVFHARGVVVGGAAHLSRAEIVDVAGVSRVTNVLWLDEGAAEGRLEAEPWVAAADVRVSFPWTIEIEVVERAPVAVATDGVGLVLVAGDGTVLGIADRTRGLPRIELPAAGLVEGARESPRGAAAALGAMPPALRAEVATVSVLVDGGLELRLRGGVTVRYGAASEHRRKSETLVDILTWADAEGERIALVNVVAPGLPAVRLAS